MFKHIEELVSRLQARLEEVSRLRTQFVAPSSAKTIKEMQVLLDRQAPYLDEIEAVLGEILVGLAPILTVADVANTARKNCNHALKHLQALEAEREIMRKEISAVKETANSAKDTASTALIGRGKTLTLAKLMDEIKKNPDLQLAIASCSNGNRNQQAPNTPVASGSGTSNLPATPTGTVVIPSTPTKEGRATDVKALQAWAHYYVKKAIGMNCRYGLAKTSKVGYLPEGQWPQPLENGEKMLEIELGNGEKELVWRPDWKKTKEPEWEPFIVQVSNQIRNTWNPRKDGEIPLECDIQATITQYTVKREAHQEQSIMNGGPPLYAWQNRRKTQSILKDRAANFLKSAPGLANKYKVFERLTVDTLFAPTLWPVDDPFNRLCSVLEQTGPNEPDIETSGWYIFRRYVHNGANDEVIQNAVEVTYPYWLSDEAIEVSAYLDELAADANAHQMMYQRRWLAPRRYWPRIVPKIKDLRAPLETDRSRPDPNPELKGAIVYRSMIHPQVRADWEANSPEIWALTYPDPPAETPAGVIEKTWQQLTVGDEAANSVKSIFNKSARMRTCPKADITSIEGLRTLAIQYATADQQVQPGFEQPGGVQLGA
ncbi:hypothetical protein FFLO_02366 [Filobasidium floriforme]|uniref:Uncharacterized protein n=2 Tax=Filobasidium floriforme TaxID=5210 RepID=A0A8K0JSY3_9TREE|nr:hypothetical protein FFLO_02366 [Filobasidium floriforme]